MKPALCFNSKKLQNIYRLDAITTADSATILNDKKDHKFSKTSKKFAFAGNHQAPKLRKYDRVQFQQGPGTENEEAKRKTT